MLDFVSGYRRSIFKLWTNYGLVAFGLDIHWTAQKISTVEGCSLIGLFPHCIDMALQGQSIVYSDSKILGFRSFNQSKMISNDQEPIQSDPHQSLSVNVVGSLYDLSLVGNPDMFALVWVKTICQFLSHSCR